MAMAISELTGDFYGIILYMTHKWVFLSTSYNW